MVKLMGLIVAFIGFTMLLVSGWTRNVGIFNISLILCFPTIFFGLRMLLG